MLLVPNIPGEDVTGGETDEANVLMGGVGGLPEFGFPFKDHLALGEELDLIDMKGAAKLAGYPT